MFEDLCHLGDDAKGAQKDLSVSLLSAGRVLVSGRAKLAWASTSFTIYLVAIQGQSMLSTYYAQPVNSPSRARSELP